MHETDTETIAAPAAARIPTTHHMDHVELLMLDQAVARVSERFFITGALNASQRAVLEEYGEDVDHLIDDLRGPARDFAEQLAELVDTVLDGSVTEGKGGDRVHRSHGTYAD
jgi:hypothetical protein